MIDIEALQEQLRREPTSKDLLEQFLSVSLTPELIADPRRIEHIVVYVRHYPRTNFARCPFVQIHPEESVESFRLVEQEWLTHLHENPDDPEISRGLALLVAESDPARALEILRAAEPNNQHDSELYTDIGRVDQSPIGRLTAFRRARDLGASQPNLLVWIAEASVDAAELEQAERAGRELLALVAEARAMYGDRLDWPERGRELWVRANKVSPERSTASELITAISNHANRKHWGHTVLGVVAARRGNIDMAVGHLAESAAVVGEPRLYSYGPSFRLARELLSHGRWDEVDAFLCACRAFWDNQEMDVWLAELTARRIPEFPDQ